MLGTGMKGGWRIFRVRLIPVREAAADARLLDRWAELEYGALEPNPFFAPQMVLPAARGAPDGGPPDPPAGPRTP